MLNHAVKTGIKGILGRLGWEVHRTRATSQLDHLETKPDYNPPVPAMADEPGWIIDIIDRVRPYTMTPPERVASLCNAIDYITRRRIPGDVVECGVWRGGSMMAAALAFLHLKDTTRSIFLFETYEGMTSPTAIDKRVALDLSASAMLACAPRDDHLWGISPLDEVKDNLASTGYPAEKLVFIKGPVEDTIPDEAPKQICILRLDTDWYESSHHELVCLYPRLQLGGVLIVDDYGWWEGQRKAINEYFHECNLAPLLIRTDASGGRIAIKS